MPDYSVILQEKNPHNLESLRLRGAKKALARAYGTAPSRISGRVLPMPDPTVAGPRSAEPRLKLRDGDCEEPSRLGPDKPHKP